MSDLLFFTGELSAALRAGVEQVKQAVEHADPARIRSADIDQLTAEFAERGRVEALELLGAQIAQSTTKLDVSGRFEYAWDPEDGPLLVDGIELALHVQFRGDPGLLRLRPSRSTFNPPRAHVRGDEIILAAAGPPQDSDRIRTNLQRDYETLRQYVEWSRADVLAHNEAVVREARQFVENRRARLSQIPDLTSGFGFPVRAATETPSVTPRGRQSEVARVPSGRAQAAQSQGSKPELLHVFLCHASQDKAAVRELHDALKHLPVDLWLDEVKLIPGQDWEREIRQALRTAHVVLVCLSRNAVTKEGFVQKEIRIALDIADEKPEGFIFVIPVRLEDCDVPERLKRWQWVDLFTTTGMQRLSAALATRAGNLGLKWPQ